MVWLTSVLAHAQQLAPGASLPFQPYFKHITLRDGLASSIVHQVMLDAKGYLWFCTDNGVSKFDGHRFTNYTAVDGLCSDMIIGGAVDSSGDVWFYSVQGELMYYNHQKDSIICCVFNAKLREELTIRSFDGIAIDQDTIRFAMHSIYYGHIVYDKEQDTIQALQVNVSHERPFAVNLGNGNHRVLSLSRPYLESVSKQFQLGIDPIPTTVAISSSSFRNKEGYVVHAGRLRMLLDQVSLEPLWVKDTDFLWVFESIYQDSQERIWAGSFGKGVFCYETATSEQHQLQLLNGLTVTGILEDAEHGFWFSTLEDGVYYYPHIPLVSIEATGPRRQLFPDQMQTDANQRYTLISTDRGELYRFSLAAPNELELVRKEPGSFLFYLEGEDSVLIFAHEPYVLDMNTLTSQDLTTFMQQKYHTTSISPFPLVTDTNNMSWFLRTDEDGVYADQNKPHYMRSEKPFQSLTGLGSLRNSLQVNPNRYYISGTDGLGYFYSDEWFMRVVDLDLPVGRGTRIVQLAIIQGDTVVAATNSAGLYLIADGKVLQQLKEDNGLLSNQCISISYQKDHQTVWLGSPEGVSALQFNGGELTVSKHLKPETGYDLTRVKCLSVIDSFLLVGTESDIHRVNLSALEYDVPIPPLQVTSVTANGRAIIPEEGTYYCDWDESVIVLRCVQPTFRNLFHHGVRYRVPELGGDWITTNENELSFVGLAPGEYHIEIQAFNPDGAWASPLQLQITVNAPYWKQPWFLLLGLGIGLTVVGFFVYQRVQFQQRVYELHMGLTDAQNRSLGAQLNPHFLYNVLNSVGANIARGDQRKSLDVVGQFARLMRAVFENSRKSLVPLEQELEAVRSYIHLEQTRLANGFDFTIECHGIDSLQVLIPPLFIQPVVENAIWHGILEVDHRGSIAVEISQEKGVLCIVVRDNGKGLPEGFQKPGTGALSGLGVLYDRIELLNKTYNNAVSLTFVNDVSEQWSTRVTILFPIIQTDQT